MLTEFPTLAFARARLLNEGHGLSYGRKLDISLLRLRIWGKGNGHTATIHPYTANLLQVMMHRRLTMATSKEHDRQARTAPRSNIPTEL
jgi:hypothetical protein